MEDRVTRQADRSERSEGAPPLGVGSVLLFALPVIAFLVEPNLASALLPIAAAAAAIALFRSRRFEVRGFPGIGWAVLAPVALLSWSALTLIWTPEGGGDFTRVLKLAGVFACAWALAVVPLGHMARPITLGVALGFAILSPILIEASVNGWFREILTKGHSVWDWYNWEKKPAVLLAIFVFPLVLGLSRCAPRAVTGAAGALFVIAVATSGYAAAILALAVGIVAALIGWRLPRIAAGAVLGALISLAFALPVILPNTSLAPVLSAVSSSSPQHRVLIADFVSARIAERPMLGWGLDASRAIPDGPARIMDTPSRADRIDPDLLAPGVRDVGQNLPLHPHSVALQIRLELGAIGAAIWIACVGVLLWRVARDGDGAARASAFGQIAAILTVWSVSFGAWQTWWLAALALSFVAARCARQAALAEKEAAPS